MKANRKSVQSDDAVSPVIAVILMVAITVVLAATVYLWVSGFGSNQRQLVQASFGAKAIDLPWSNTDTDSNDDAVEITYASGDSDLANADVSISVDGTLLNWTSADNNFYPGGTFGTSKLCTTSPGGDANGNWERGASVILLKGGTAATINAECDGSPGTPLNTKFATLKGLHTIKVSVKGQVVLDTTIEVHDDASAN